MVPTAAGRTPDDPQDAPLLPPPTGPNQPDPTLLPPLTLEEDKHPGSSQPCPGRPPPTGSSRWRGVPAETSAGHTIGALCGPLELTGPELRYCALRHTHADEVRGRRDAGEQMTNLSAFYANLAEFSICVPLPTPRPPPPPPSLCDLSPSKLTQLMAAGQWKVKRHNSKYMIFSVLLGVFHLQSVM